MSRIKPRYKVGSKVFVSEDNDNESYNSFRMKELIVTAVYESEKDHPGFDGEVEEALYDLKTVDGKEVGCSLYEYELEDA